MKVKREGVGMIQRTVEVYDHTDDPEVMIRAFSNMKGAKQVWAEAEEWCLRVLRRAGVDTESDKAMFLARCDFPENTAQFLAIEWLRAWRNAQGARAAGNIDGAMMFAEDMGRIKERIFWRCGVDPDTGERREALALREKSAIDHRREGGATNAAAAEARRATALRLAGEIKSKRTRPISALALAKEVRAAWPDEDPPSVERLRKIVGQA